jgi:aspartate aminotransferase
MNAFTRAARITDLEISEIVQLSEKAAALKAAGRDVVALSTGEPDFPTPDHVIEAAHRAALAGKTRYPATLGTAELRAAIAAQNGVTPAEVMVSTGAKQVLANAMLASLNPGDEVIMPAPYWTSYSDIVLLAGGRPVVIPCPMADGFKLSPAALAAAITPRTRWLLLNSPANPSGAVYSPEADAGPGRRAVAAIPRSGMHLGRDLRSTSELPVPFTSFRNVAAPELADRTADGGWRVEGLRDDRLADRLGHRVQSALIGAMDRGAGAGHLGRLFHRSVRRPPWRRLTGDQSIAGRPQCLTSAPAATCVAGGA